MVSAEPFEEHDSLVHVSPREAFPKPPLHMDNPALECPYPELCGEGVEFIGDASDGAVIVISNYRFLICYPKSFVNVPVGLIETADCRDQESLVVTCKDGKLIRCQFDTSDQCQEWLYRICKAIEAPAKLEDIFAFSFHAWCFDYLHRDQDTPSPGVCFLEGTGKVTYQTFAAEIERQGYDLKKAWRIFDNSDFKYCTTYPTQHVIPGNVKDEMMKKSANFRTSKRFPSVVWRHKGNGAVIARCSQPAVGWLGWRSEEDEKIMEAILNACHMDDPRRQESCHSNGFICSDQNGIPNCDSEEETPRTEFAYNDQSKMILIVDARSYAAAFANRAKGGGCEYPEYYTCCDIEFMGLANIHTIRKSFHNVHTLCSNTALDQSIWLSSLETTKWLQNLSMLLKSAIKVVTAIDQEARPVVVHCSDGWDRTPQIVALAEIMLDPYYRTMQGFQVLVEREWLDFGHKFADRCGHRPGHDDANERCPVFLQWLDCIHQLLRQYPTSFEFNETFLVKLVQHTYSCLFGTFLCNTLKARLKNSLKERTCSVWSLLAVEGNKYTNFLYDPKMDKVLYPSSNVRDLDLWIDVYLSETSRSICEDSGPAQAQQNAQSGPSPADSPKLARTQSFDNIHKTASEDEPHRPNIGSDIHGLTRTSSDPNLSDLKLEPSLGTSPKTRMMPPLPLDRGDEEEESLKNGSLSSESDESEKDSDSNTPAENGAGEAGLTNGELTPEDASEAQSSGDGETDQASNGHDDALSNGLTNGHADLKLEQEPAEAPSPACSTPRKADLINLMLDCQMESSTETVTDDRSGAIQLEEPQALRGAEDCNGVDDSPCDTNGSVTPRGEQINGHAAFLKGQLQNSISTSTTDISNSHVDHPLGKSASLPLEPSSYIPYLPDNGETFGSLGKYSQSLSQRAVTNGLNFLPQTSVASEPSFSTCLSRTSSCSNGNGMDPSGEEAGADAHRQLKLGRHLGQDGLTCPRDLAQRRMLAILQEKQKKEEMMLQRERFLLAFINRLRQEMASNTNTGATLASALEEVDIDNGNLLHPDDEERRSASRCNSIRSDVSWEQIEEGDTNRTLWIPDHAVSHCFQCNSRFTLVNRKHHCRNCGQIFCTSCSAYSAAIPREQLYQPQRVCKPCFDTLDSEARRRHEQAMEGSRQMGTVRDG
ncbi:phosphatidylinositol-3,5-bisphosphate 3-phosphatase MTMR4-like [Diadema setosum]|uniref:phosphatidylinositol-3,5-bisphosphate 3-phosphatase MTMR4-like n=1 Tax=Diadema setosum TaxID=31175 RepID=UPI003B3ACAC5